MEIKIKEDKQQNELVFENIKQGEWFEFVDYLDDKYPFFRLWGSKSNEPRFCNSVGDTWNGSYNGRKVIRFRQIEPLVLQRMG